MSLAGQRPETSTGAPAHNQWYDPNGHQFLPSETALKNQTYDEFLAFYRIEAGNPISALSLKNIAEGGMFRRAILA
jgi:hypothetical protein